MYDCFQFRINQKNISPLLPPQRFTDIEKKLPDSAADAPTNIYFISTLITILLQIEIGGEKYK